MTLLLLLTAPICHPNPEYLLTYLLTYLPGFPGRPVVLVLSRQVRAASLQDGAALALRHVRGKRRRLGDAADRPTRVAYKKLTR